MDTCYEAWVCIYCGARGVPLEVVQANVGHTSIETTMRYLELQPDYIRKQSMKISDLYQSKEAGDKSMQ